MRSIAFLNKYIFCLVIFLFHSTVQGVSPIEREMILLIECDKFETIEQTLEDFVDVEGLSAISVAFLIALFQGAAPIVVSQAVVDNILNHATLARDIITKKKQYYTKYKGKNYNERLRLLNKRYKELEELLSDFLDKKYDKDTTLKKIKEIASPELPKDRVLGLYLSCLYAPFDRYIIKKLDKESSYYLFIPKSYLKKLDENYEHKPSTDFKSPKSNLEKIDKTLGLKFSFFPDVALKVPEEFKKTNVTQCTPNTLPLLQSIFITKDAIKEEELKTWGLYLLGHGEYKGNVAGMSLENFKKILSFFNDKIKTNFLLYSTCYAGGEHFIDAYQKGACPSIFNFVISSAALTDALLYGKVPKLPIFSLDDVTINKVFDEENKSLKLITPIDLKKFFAGLKESEKPLPFEKILSYAINFIDYTKTPPVITNWNNVPSIRFPGAEWFSVVNLHKNILKVTKVRTKAQQGKPLPVNNKEGILLYVNEIPFPLEIESKDFPAIVSMLPGAQYHIFKKISAPYATLNEALQSFLKIKSLKAPKLFVGILELPGSNVGFAISIVEGKTRVVVIRNSGQIKEIINPYEDTDWTKEGATLNSFPSNLFDNFNITDDIKSKIKDQITKLEKSKPLSKASIKNAIKFNKLNLLQELLKNNPELKKEITYNDLQTAKKNKNPSMVELLLKINPELKKASKNAINDLQTAIKNKKHSMVTHLLKSNPELKKEISYKDLQTAIKNKDHFMAEVLLEGNPELKKEISYNDLQTAIKNKDAFMVEDLLKINPELKKEITYNDLQTAIKNKNYSMAKLLLESNPELKKEITYNDLQTAIKNKNPSMVKLLLESNPELKKEIS